MDAKRHDGIPTGHRFRHCIFVINNYTAGEVTGIRGLTSPSIEYLVYQLEVSGSGTNHIQGYVEAKEGRTKRAWCTLLGGRAYVDQRRGTREQARAYQVKQDRTAIPDTIYTYGTWKPDVGQGHRSDIAALYTSLEEGKTEAECLALHPVTILAHERIYQNYHRIQAQAAIVGRTSRNIKTTVLYGETGVGKTRLIYHHYPHLYRLCPSGTNQWFDGYQNQKVLLLDDFFGSSMSYTHLLQLLDRYYIRLQTKGGHTIGQWSRIFITSNNHPNDWYPNVRNTEALIRRMKLIECTPAWCIRNGVALLPDDVEELSDDLIDE